MYPMTLIYMGGMEFKVKVKYHRDMGCVTAFLSIVARLEIRRYLQV
jgi:hypothetical protein